MSVFISVGGVNREVKEIYHGSGGVNRKVKERYHGSGGVNRPVFKNLPGWLYYYGNEYLGDTTGWALELATSGASGKPKGEIRAAEIYVATTAESSGYQHARAVTTIRGDITTAKTLRVYCRGGGVRKSRIRIGDFGDAYGKNFNFTATTSFAYKDIDITSFTGSNVKILISAEGSWDSTGGGSPDASSLIIESVQLLY